MAAQLKGGLGPLVGPKAQVFPKINFDGTPNLSRNSSLFKVAGATNIKWGYNIDKSRMKDVLFLQKWRAGGNGKLKHKPSSLNCEEDGEDWKCSD